MDTNEEHFNELQYKTRAIASTWILAGFAGIAFFIDTKGPVLAHFSGYTMINLVCLMVVIGLLTLWILDQLVYQRLLNANFVVGLYDEYANPQAPPIRTLMIAGSEWKGMSRLYNLFYFIPMLTFTVFATVSLLVELLASSGQDAPWSTLAIGVLLIVITALVWSYIFSNKRSIPYHNLLESFDDEGFKHAASPQGCAAIVRRWRDRPSIPGPAGAATTGSGIMGGD